MANVLGGAGVFSGPTGPEQMAMNLQALSQSAQNLGNTAQLRIQDLENRRNAFLNFAKANGQTPAFMLSTPKGEAAAKALLGDNFFGMIGPNKAKWEAFFGMPMSEEDWEKWNRLETLKGNLIPPKGPEGSAQGASDAPLVTGQVASAQTSVPLSAAPSAPASAPAPGDSRTAGQLGQSIVQTEPFAQPSMGVIPAVPAEIGIAAMTPQQLVAAGSDPESAGYRGKLGLTTQESARMATEVAKRDLLKTVPAGADGVGVLRDLMNSSPDSLIRQAAWELLQERSITTSDYNPDGTLKSSTAATPATTAPGAASALADTERAFREELIRRFPEQKDKILRLPLKVLEDNNKPTYDRYFGPKAAGNTGAGADTGAPKPAEAAYSVSPRKPRPGLLPPSESLDTVYRPRYVEPKIDIPTVSGKAVAGVPLSAEPTRRELATVTATVDKVASEAARTWRANPDIQDAGYRANLETAAKMMSLLDPGTGRLEDHPVMARAVLNFTKQAYRKVESDIEAATIGSKIDAATLMLKLGAQSTLSALASSQQAMEVLKVVQAQWDSKYKPQIEAHAKAGKKPDEIAKIMATDPAYMAMDRMIQTANARAYGDGSVVTQLYLKDPVSFLRTLFGAMPTETFVGYGVAPGYGFTESDPTAADALVSTITSELK